MKRLIDIVGAAVGITVLSPLLFVAVVAVWATMGLPVFFRQSRPGLKGKTFQLIKLRTMSDKGESDNNTEEDQCRVTAVGKLLRSTSVDEIPELWNVLKGDMSLVGPRPLLVEYLPLYSEEQARRHSVKPGLTGWAQINGRNTLSWEEKFALDVWYVDNHTALLDLKIIFLTLKKVVAREGISASGQITMPKFTGNQK